MVRSIIGTMAVEPEPLPRQYQPTIESESKIIPSVQESVQSESVTSSDELGKVFLGLFSNRFDSLIATYGSGKWRPVSRLHYLSDTEIGEVVSGAANCMRAIQPDSTNCYTVLEVDFERRNVLNQVWEALRSCGIEHFQILKSNESENLQIYIFWDRQVSLADVEELFDSLITAQSLTSCIRVISQNLILPLQRGFAWLNENCSIKQSRDELNPDQAMEYFLADLINRPLNYEHVVALIKSTLIDRHSKVADVDGILNTDGSAVGHLEAPPLFEGDIESRDVSNQKLDYSKERSNLSGAENSLSSEQQTTASHRDQESLSNQKPQLPQEIEFRSSDEVTSLPLYAPAKDRNHEQSFSTETSKSKQQTTQFELSSAKCLFDETGGSARASPKDDSFKQLTLNFTPKSAREKKLSGQKL